MDAATLFPDLTPERTPSIERRHRIDEVRFVRPDRSQMRMVPVNLEESIPADHPARSIWGLVERMDLSRFYTDIQSMVDGPGRPATDPQVLLALWLYATAEGVGSARQVARLCEEHDAFRWLCGGVPVNYHMLADFRVAHGAALDGLLTEVLAALMKKKLVRLKDVAQDGMRVRANAGAASFRRGETLQDCLKAAQDQVAQVALQREHPDPGVSKRQLAARERAAEERQARVAEALKELELVKAAKARQLKTTSIANRAKVQEARASSTDPAARVMKMADGGFRSAYNVQLAVDADSQVVVGVKISNQGSDQGQILAMVQQVAQRTRRDPYGYLVDGGFVDLDEIAQMGQRGISVYAPPRKRDEAGKNHWRPIARGPEVMEWRSRMDTEEGKAVYRKRAASVECVNAQERERYGLQRFLVRGLAKTTCVVLLTAITHNLLRWLSLDVPAQPSPA